MKKAPRASRVVLSVAAFLLCCAPARPSAGAADAAPTTAQFREALDKIVSDFPVAMRNVKEQEQVSSIVRAYMDLRMSKGVRPYDKDKQFQEGLRSCCDDVLKRLNAGTEGELSQKQIKFFKTHTLSGYKANRAEFTKFWQGTLSKDERFSKLKPNEVTKAMAYFSLAAYRQDPASWLKRWKATYVFPICHHRPQPRPKEP